MFHADKKRPIIISVGGSLIIPNGGIDADFLAKLNAFIRKEVAEGRRFILSAGGGRTARHYRDAGKAVVGNMSDEDLDWIGVHATRLNGHLLRTIFQDIAHPRIIENYEKKLVNWKEPIVIGAGWKPGWSTDYCAVLLAKEYNSNIIINLSNIDGVYDKDPRQYKDAKIIKKMTWEEMEKLVPTAWKPGTNSPFDPVATQLAKKFNLTVIVANGKDFQNIEKIIAGDTFKGTVISPPSDSP
ncbi:UMP kinase [Candidatus Roizmanbacteria bacterium]|nr:UMP kinase [Candidatus Roizmanbacteria bacterium]